MITAHSTQSDLVANNVDVKAVYNAIVAFITLLGVAKCCIILTDSDEYAISTHDTTTLTIP